MNQPNESFDKSTSWDAEYGGKGIPSSWKDGASTVVSWGLESLKWLGTHVDASDMILDIGCGTGRNSIAVAKALGCRVEGFDYSAQAVALATERVDHDPAVRKFVKFRQHDARDELPVGESSVQLALDIFVYFHLLLSSDRAAYRTRLRRALRPDGVLLLSLATDDDGYYSTCSPLPQAADERIPIVLDNNAGVGNIMHSLQSLVSEMSDTFDLVMSWQKTADGPMHGKMYERRTLATLWRPIPR